MGKVSVSIVEHGGKVRPVELEGETGVKFWLQGLAASHRKIGAVAYQMDGATDNGLVFDALVRPLEDAGAAEAVLIEQATVTLAEIYKPIGDPSGSKVFIPEINASLTLGGGL